MTTEKYVRPSDIKFSQDFIEPSWYSSGERLEEAFSGLLQQLQEKRWLADTVQPITVMNCSFGVYNTLLGNHDYWVVDGEQWLYLFRKLEALGELTYIKVKVQAYDESKVKKRTTTNGGASVAVWDSPNMEGRLEVVYMEWKYHQKTGGKIMMAIASAFAKDSCAVGNLLHACSIIVCFLAAK